MKRFSFDLILITAVTACILTGIAGFYIGKNNACDLTKISELKLQPQPSVGAGDFPNFNFLLMHQLKPSLDSLNKPYTLAAVENIIERAKNKTNLKKSVRVFSVTATDYAILIGSNRPDDQLYSLTPRGFYFLKPLKIVHSNQ